MTCWKAAQVLSSGSAAVRLRDHWTSVVAERLMHLGSAKTHPLQSMVPFPAVAAASLKIPQGHFFVAQFARKAVHRRWRITATTSCGDEACIAGMR
jgi:hypothetical protein